MQLGSAFLLLGAIAAICCAGCRTPNHAPALSRNALARDEAAETKLEQRAQAHAHYAAGVVHELNGDAPAANIEYREAALGDPADEALVLEVSRRLIQAKDLEGALAVASRSAARSNASGSIHARLGLIYGQLGRHEEALSANRAAIQKTPGLLAPYQNIFVGHVQNREEQAAWDVLGQASAQTNTSPEFLIGLAELYSNFGIQFPSRREEAKQKTVEMLSRVAQTESLNPGLLLVLAENLNQAGESTRAAQLYNLLLKNAPNVPGLRERVHAKLSEIYLRAEDREKAAEQLQALLREDPTNPQAHYFLGALAMDARKPVEAVDHFNRALLLNPDFEPVHYDLANAQLSAQKPADALATLEKARQKFPDSFVREFLAGVAYTQQKAYKEAVQRLTSAEVIARASDPKRLTHFFYFQLGAAYERNGQIPEAEKAFTKCLELEPDFASGLNYLGYMWADRGEKLEQAHELIQKAVKAEPQNAAYLDSLGWVLFKMGKPAEALEHIQKAVELSEEPDATLFEHLGDIQAALGNRSAAEEAWKKSLEIEDNPTVRKKLEPQSAR